jgi:DNA-binding GntR family transcriptional regulator
MVAEQLVTMEALARSTEREPQSAVARAVDGVRSMILSRELLPGEQIRQAETASLLQVSRIPLREALSVLATEGLLRHSPNQGYFVAKLSTDELAQIYRMRELLEAELILSLDPPEPGVVDLLTKTNNELERVAKAGLIDTIIEKNRLFHFTIFDASPLRLMATEVHRLWDRSDGYRSLYLTDEGVRQRIAGEHRAIIDAWTSGNRLQMVEACNRHRLAAATRVADMLDQSYGPIASPLRASLSDV